MLLRMALAAIASLVLCKASVANCRYDPFDFFPDRNRGANVALAVENTGFCRHHFEEGPGYRFTSVKADLAPAHGKLERQGDAAFVYTPAPGFTGKDAYGFKICATKAGKSGCSSLRFDATVDALEAGGCGEGTPEQMIAACTQVIDKASADNAERLRALRSRGVALFRARDLDHALADLSAALAIDSTDYVSLNNRGLIHQWRKELDSAVADFDKAVGANPGAYASYANRSNAYRLKGDFARALADAERCVELAPKFGGCYKARGLAREKLGKTDSVLPDLSKAVELAPDDAEARAVRAPHLLARGDFRGAASDYDAALKANPEDGAIVVGHGVALMELGDFAGAIGDFDRALKLAPAAGIHVNRGFAHFGDGDFAAAAVDFQDWAAAKPDHPYASLWLYLALARAGKTDAPPPAAAVIKVWPAPVLDYFAGKATLTQLDADARDGGDDQFCEAAFYAGEKALIDSHADEAAREMKQALETCRGPSLERAAALGETRRLAVSAGERK
jgi:tetratricopeptide (TPR) repeat protein